MVVGPSDVAKGVGGVGDLVVVYHERGAVGVGTAGQLIPGVIGNAVAVGVFGHHHDAGLAVAGVGVALDVEVALTAHVGDAVVEVEGDVSAIGAQGHQPRVVACDGLGAFRCHRGGRVVGGAFGQGVDELSRSRHILVYGQDVFAVGLGSVVLGLEIGFQVAGHEDGMGRDVACPHRPFPLAVTVEAVELAARHVVGGVHHEDVVGLGVYGDAVGGLDGVVGRFLQRVLVNDAFLLEVDDAKRLDLSACGIKGGAVVVEGVALYAHPSYGDIDAAGEDHLSVGILLEPVEVGSV